MCVVLDNEVLENHVLRNDSLVMSAFGLEGSR